MDVQMNKVLIPLPSYGFDPTEAAIPWKLLSAHDFEVVFGTPEGLKASADRRMLTGEDFGILKYVFQARRDAIDAYHEMEQSDSFCNPLKYVDLHEKDFDGLLLPGGHDKNVKEYLESKVLQDLVVEFFNAKKPVGAICHGVILPARSINPDTGKSVLYKFKTTALQNSQELLGYNLTRLWLGDYLLTYPECTVENEIRAVLAEDDNFIEGPPSVLRDSPDNPGRGFVVRDRNYVSARWYGDAYSFAFEFIKVMQELGR
jgi:protease I